MKKFFKAIAIIGLISIVIAGVSILIRNNYSSSSGSYPQSSAGKSNTTISQIYTGEETIYF